MPGRSITLPFSGECLRKVRERHGLTQKQLADRCCDAGHSMSRSSVAGYESGDRKPRPGALQALVAGFDGLAKRGKPISVDDFLTKAPKRQTAVVRS